MGVEPWLAPWRSRPDPGRDKGKGEELAEGGEPEREGLDSVVEVAVVEPTVVGPAHE